ncbi:MAG TPA: phosphatase PAP2 family protein [Pilimelia sp.]|nr:phosphatase PAP2 family protein [Pilimelia sp.]
MRRWPVGLALWLLVLGAAEVVAFVLTWRFFVLSEHGQSLDTAALTGNSIGRARVADLVDTVLTAVSAASLLAATATVAFIGLIRRRVAVAAGAVLLVVGATVTTQVLKRVIARPDLGIDVERAAAGNSLPSGHTTVAAAVALALVLVLPDRVRGAAAVLGTVGTALVGIATLSAGWHRPSDAAAAVLVAGGWACAAGLFILLAQRRHGDVTYAPRSRFGLLTLVLGGVAALAGAVLAIELTDRVLATPPEDLGRSRLLIAYAGGALGIAGTASLVVTAVLATAHRVVPREVAVPAAPPLAVGAAER